MMLSQTIEPEIVYDTTFMKHLESIWNLRITYPNTDILLFDDDVKGAFRHSKYHPDIDIGTGPIVFILGAIDSYKKKYKLFHLTIQALSRIKGDIPILLKPHAYTEMETVYKAIEGLNSFHITYLHPSVLATNARVFISNNFSNTLNCSSNFNFIV